MEDLRVKSKEAKLCNFLHLPDQEVHKLILPKRAFADFKRNYMLVDLHNSRRIRNRDSDKSLECSNAVGKKLLAPAKPWQFRTLGFR